MDRSVVLAIRHISYSPVLETDQNEFCIVGLHWLLFPMIGVLVLLAHCYCLKKRGRDLDEKLYPPQKEAHKGGCQNYAILACFMTITHFGYSVVAVVKGE